MAFIVAVYWGYWAKITLRLGRKLSFFATGFWFGPGCDQWPVMSSVLVVCCRLRRGLDSGADFAARLCVDLCLADVLDGYVLGYLVFNNPLGLKKE